MKPITFDNTTTATTTTNPSPISQSQGSERRTQDLFRVPQDNIPLTHYDIASVDTSKPGHLTNEKTRLEAVLLQLNTVLQIYQETYPFDRSRAADLLFSLGKTYRLQGDKLINHLSSLLCFEKSLKICLARKSIDHKKLSIIYTELGRVHKDLKDINKAFACLKKAFWLSNQSVRISSEITALLQIENFKDNDIDLCTRSCIILLYGEFDDNLALFKQKIQSALLDKIAKAVEQGYGWSYISYTYLGSELGVKGYVDKDYIKKILKGLGELGENEKNIELAQMLCFEAINLAKSKILTKSYEYCDIAAQFTKAYPDLIKKIENEHPEF
ncbi:MAG: hypothetical protein C5B43_02570, partial [Verrucomicrobia bacterium]